jgi:subtilisin family serine protease
MFGRRRVQAFVSGGRTPVTMRDLVYDSGSGRWFGPSDTFAQEEALERFYGISQEIPEAEQDVQLDQRLSGLLTVVVDSGVMHAHPMLQGRVEHEQDFTGEGPEDLHGHGTVVALEISAVRFWPLANLKVLDRHANGSAKALRRALKWVGEFARQHPNVVVIANLSVGVYSRRWLLWRCRGSCRVCKAAKAAADAGASVMAAAGNTPGKTACPATVSLHNDRRRRIFAVEAPDVPTSGIGVIGTSGQTPQFVPVP